MRQIESCLWYASQEILFLQAFHICSYKLACFLPYIAVNLLNLGLRICTSMCRVSAIFHSRSRRSHSGLYWHTFSQLVASLLLLLLHLVGLISIKVSEFVQFQLSILHPERPRMLSSWYLRSSDAAVSLWEKTLYHVSGFVEHSDRGADAMAASRFSDIAQVPT